MEIAAHQQLKGFAGPTQQVEQADSLNRQVVALLDQITMLFEQRQPLSGRAVELPIQLVELEQHPRVGRIEREGSLKTRQSALRVVQLVVVCQPQVALDSRESLIQRARFSQQ